MQKDNCILANRGWKIKYSSEFEHLDRDKNLMTYIPTQTGSAPFIIKFASASQPIIILISGVAGS